MNLTAESVSQFWAAGVAQRQDRLWFELWWDMKYPKPEYRTQRRQWREWMLAREVAWASLHHGLED